MTVTGHGFDIRLGARSLPLLRLWGVKPGLAYADVVDGDASEGSSARVASGAAPHSGAAATSGGASIASAEPAPGAAPSRGAPPAPAGRGDFVDIRFGRFRFRAPLSNVTRWRIEGPWRWITAIGLRRSIRHGDISFAGSPRGGVRLDFREPVPWWIFRVPAVYVGVEDLEGFAAAMSARGIPGEDARSPETRKAA